MDQVLGPTVWIFAGAGFRHRSIAYPSLDGPDGSDMPMSPISPADPIRPTGLSDMIGPIGRLVFYCLSRASASIADTWRFIVSIAPSRLTAPVRNCSMLDFTGEFQMA